jgi:hypothetical protein
MIIESFDAGMPAISSDTSLFDARALGDPRVTRIDEAFEVDVPNDLRRCVVTRADDAALRGGD